jgi:hypothetical protein
LKKVKLHAKDLAFESIFASVPTDSSSTYCLLGTGFFRAPSSKNADSLIADWLIRHPNANIVPVSTLTSIQKDEPKHAITYCLLIDDHDTINNYLIRNGCYQGGTMVRPEPLSKEDKEFEKQISENDTLTYDLDKKSYDIYIEQIKADEIFAKTNKLGIWSDSQF